MLNSRYHKRQNASVIADVIVSLVELQLAQKVSISLKKEVATVSIKLTPLEDKIIVKQAQAETQTASGLYIPDNAKEKPQQGEVLAVGPGRRDDKGERIPMMLRLAIRCCIPSMAALKCITKVRIT